MSEEIKETPGSDALSGAAAVVPPENTTETPPVAQVNPADLIPSSEPTGEEQKETSTQETAPAAEVPAREEQPKPEEKIEISEELFNQAVSAITTNGRCARAWLAATLKINKPTVDALTAMLVERKIIGGEGPNKKILIEHTDANPEVRALKEKKAAQAAEGNVQKKATPHDRPQRTGTGAPMRRKTDYDRLLEWKEDLKTRGGFTDEEVINMIAQYALRNQGFNPKEHRGKSLIVMINRWVSRLRDDLRSFTLADSEFMFKELLSFIQSQPLGDGPAAWNTNYSNNKDQRDVVSRFFSINKPIREYTAQDHVIATVRNGAWPSIKEEERGIGGSFAERLHYLILAIIAFGGDNGDKFWGQIIHDGPSDKWLENHGLSKEQAKPWHDGTKCLACGSPLTTDSNGNTICSSFTCMRHFAQCETDITSFKKSGKLAGPREGFVPGNIPVGGGDVPRRRNWKEQRGSRHDHNDDDEGRQDFRRRRGGKQRWRDNQNEDDRTPASTGTGEPQTVISSGTDTGNTPFAGLSLS